MTVTRAYTVDQGIFDIDRSPPMLALSDSRAKVFLVGNLCNHAHLDKGKFHGQATEVALMNVLKDVGMGDQRQVRFLLRLSPPFLFLFPSLLRHHSPY
jgi:Ca2+-transporting ATPase